MKREKLMVGGIAAIIVLLVAVIIILLMRPTSKEITISDTGSQFQMAGNVITSSLTDEELEAMRKAAEEAAKKNQIGVEYQRTLTFENSSSKGQGLIGNPKSNYYPTYFTVETEGKEVIRTGLVPIGARLEEFTLTTPLEKGTYEGYLKYHAVDEETQEVVTESMPMVVDIVING